jgi:hypothetical protein
MARSRKDLDVREWTNVMRKRISKGLALAALALGLAAQPARADIATSMTAQLVGSDIVFLLLPTQPGKFWLHDLTITSASWLFDPNPANIQIREGSAVGIDRTANYTPQIVDGNLTFESNSATVLAQAALAPIWIKVGLVSQGANLTATETSSPRKTRCTRANPSASRWTASGAW